MSELPDLTALIRANTPLIVIETQEAVSYTHLDVYKRQTSERAASAIEAARSRCALESPAQALHNRTSDNNSPRDNQFMATPPASTVHATRRPRDLSLIHI